MIARIAACVCALLIATEAHAQLDIGHKTLGTAGLRAGAQAPPGIYIADRFIGYSADEVVDRRGERIDVGLAARANAYALGAKAVFLLPFHRTHLGVALALPVARIHVDTLRPLSSIDRFGLGDVYAQPLQLGWRLPNLDVVTGYGVYLPTGRYEPRGGSGVGRGHVTHQMFVGGTVYFDSARTWHLSALASYDLNERKRGIDITRGDTVQIQGGAGKRILIFELGVVGYALWQARDDRGADLPQQLRGARDRVVGLGAEASALLPWIRGQLSIRYARDVTARSRPMGAIFVVSLNVALSR